MTSFGDEEKKVFNITVTDITTRKELEQEREETLRQLTKKNQYLEISAIINSTIQGSLDLNYVIERAVEAMYKYIDSADNVALYLVEGKEAVIKAYKGYSESYIEKAGRIPYPKGFTWKTILEGKARYSPNVDKDDVIGPAGRKVGTKSYVSMPIRSKGKVVGCININSLRYNAFDVDELKLLDVVAKQIETAINNAALAEELREQKRFLDTLISNIPGLVFRCRHDSKRTMLFMSEGRAELTGYESSDPLMNKEISYIDIIHPDDREYVLNMIDHCLEKKRAYQIGYRIITANRNIKWIWEQGRGVYGSDGRLIYLEGLSTDISDQKKVEIELANTKNLLEDRVQERTKELKDINENLKREISDRKRIEQALEERDHWLRLAISSANIATIDWNIKSDTATCSSLYYSLFGIDPKIKHLTKEIWLNCIHPEDRELVAKTLKGSLEDREPFDIEFRAVWPDGSVHWLFNKSKVFYDQTGEPHRLVGAIIDITDRKEFAQRIQESLSEKEILLREIHHRVKNNLQIVSSILNLHSGSIKNLEARESFIDSRNRVKIISIIHEHLYQSGDLVTVDCKKFITKLINHIQNFQDSGLIATNLRLDIDPLSLSVEKAIPCSLIINELISNAFKHGLTGRRDETVYLHLKSVAGDSSGTIATNRKNDKLILTIGNTGEKFPDQIDFRKSDSLGFQLVCALTQQLKGEIVLNKGEGTEFQITFPY